MREEFATAWREGARGGIAEKLPMGYEWRVSPAVSWVEASRARNVVELRRKLQDYRA
jgi:hypothetical protein